MTDYSTISSLIKRSVSAGCQNRLTKPCSYAYLIWAVCINGLTSTHAVIATTDFRSKSAYGVIYMFTLWSVADSFCMCSC